MLQFKEQHTYSKEDIKQILLQFIKSDKIEAVDYFGKQEKVVQEWYDENIANPLKFYEFYFQSDNQYSHSSLCTDKEADTEKRFGYGAIEIDEKTFYENKSLYGL